MYVRRIEKRALKKDKSLVCGLYNIIDKYLPRLFIMFSELSDKRQQGKVTYSTVYWFTIITFIIFFYCSIIALMYSS